MWPLLVLSALLWPLNKAAIRGDADSFMSTFNVLQDCRPSVKNVRNLKTGGAIFTLDERQNELTAAVDYYLCHYELETAPGYGFHVYIDEMYLEERPNNSCLDYLQFGRDTTFVTVHKSGLFCGSRSRITNSPIQLSNGTMAYFTGGQGMRMYVEEADHEMDVWITIYKRSGGLNANLRPRLLNMTVTVIKKECEEKHPFFRQCPHSQHCVRREFFCDGRVNCAWPDAEAGGTDEAHCDAEGEEAYKGTFNTMGAKNIPLVIVMIIAATVMIVVFLLFGKKLFGVFFKGGPFLVPQGINFPHPAPPSEPSETTPSLVVEHEPRGQDEEDGLPTAPPSYEDVIKDNPGVLAGGVPMAPPSYSESVSTSPTTTQV